MRVTIIDQSRRCWNAQTDGPTPKHPAFIQAAGYGQLADGSRILEVSNDLYPLKAGTLTPNAAAYLALTAIDAMHAWALRYPPKPTKQLGPEHSGQLRWPDQVPCQSVYQLDVRCCWSDGLGRAQWLATGVVNDSSRAKKSQRRRAPNDPVRSILDDINRLIRPHERRMWKTVRKVLEREYSQLRERSVTSPEYPIEQLRLAVEQHVPLEPLPVLSFRPAWAEFLHQSIDATRARLGNLDANLKRYAQRIERLSVNQAAQQIWVRRLYMAVIALALTGLGVLII